MSAARAFERHDLMTDAGPLRVLVHDPAGPRQRRRSNRKRSRPHGHAGAASAFVVGTPPDGCLVRIHSRCLYGDVIGSLECDCRAQLEHSLARMRDEHAGVLIYLDQEGRGAGLVPKARAYRRREDEDIDSFTSYERDGLPPDPRTYDAAVAIVRELGLEHVRLLTNNWEKIAALSDAGIKVERESLVVPFAPEAESYLRSKLARGHELDGLFPGLAQPAAGGAVPRAGEVPL
jgi:GTP cyclohydrolase II